MGDGGGIAPGPKRHPDTVEVAGGPVAEPGPDRSGEVLGGRYALKRRLAFGAIGEVYEALDRAAKRRVAVKMLHPERGSEPETVARFFREAAVLAQVEHPHVAAALDMGQTAEEVLFLVLELVEGVTLAEAIARDGPFPADRAVFVADQLCSALEAIHAQGVLHRDLKPENILLTAQGGHRDYVKVIDFGIAQLQARPGRGAPKLTAEGMVQGTAEYMSPEQAVGGTLDVRSDLYSLGVVLFELLTGELPFDAPERYAIMRQHLDAPVPRLSQRRAGEEIPRSLERIVRRLLAKHPADRFEDAPALREALGRVWGGPAAPGWRARWRGAERWWRARPTWARRVALVTAGALVVGMAAMGWIATRGGGASGVAAGSGGGGGRRDADSTGRVESTGKPSPGGSVHRSGAGHGSVSVSGSVSGHGSGVGPGSGSGSGGGSASAPIRPSAGSVAFQRVWALLAQGDELGAVRAAAAALAARPALAEDPRLADAVFRAALDGRGQASEEARALVVRAMAQVWRGRLERAARDGTRPSGRRRATAMLRESGQWGALEPWSQAVIALRAATSCEALTPWVARLAAAPDRRALPALRALAGARAGCGPSGRGDCVACVRPALEALIKRLEEAGP